MNGGVSRAQDRRNLLERLGAKIPGFKGYLEKELRREVDKMQRDWLASQLDRCRQGVGARIRDWSRSGNLANLDLASSIDKLLDRFGNRIRHADYGYSGFFDAVKIREDELDRIYEFDLGLTERVEDIARRIESLPGTASEPELRSVLSSVEAADHDFDERARIFEDVTQKGGR
jgi:hypothetical protein